MSAIDTYRALQKRKRDRSIVESGRVKKAYRGFDEMVSDFESEIRDGFNWLFIKQEICSQEPCREDPYSDAYKAIFFGSVLGLTPSGKYYTPFACGNVTMEESVRDEAWWKALESVLEDHELFYFSGDGDPTDILVGMTVEGDGQDG